VAPSAGCWSSWYAAFLKAIPFLPLGTVTSWLLVIGGGAFIVAGLIVAGALLMANPRKRWGDPLVGGCPVCGKWTLRQGKVAPRGSGPQGRGDPLRHGGLRASHAR
jgi:hypothetical protein